MSAAKTLSLKGYETHIVEKSDVLGGQALNLFKTISGDDVQKKLS